MMDMGDVLPGEASEKAVTLTNAGMIAHGPSLTPEHG